MVLIYYPPLPTFLTPPITELENENYEFLHPDNTVVCQKEVLDNSIDEFVMGAGKTIEVSVQSSTDVTYLWMHL